MPAIRPIKLVRLLPLIVAVVILANAASSETPDDDASGPVVAINYSISDLPVYQQGEHGGKFDPSLLIAHIKSSVAPSSWKTHGQITAFPQNLSIVVEQTEANHAKLADLLKSLREHQAD